MNVLVIDDEEDPRQKWFKRNLTWLGWSISSARTSAEAYALLRTQWFQVAFFDHDLGEEETGSTIASRILMDPDQYHCPQCVWVHSANPVGAENIASKFRSAAVPTVVCDFGQLRETPVWTVRAKIYELVPQESA